MSGICILFAYLKPFMYAYAQASPRRALFFDGIYISSPYILNKVRVFCNENPHLIVIGAGDVKQLPSIEPSTNNQNGEEYVDNCLGKIFKYTIFLQMCKTVGGKDTEEGERNRKKVK